jgi:hypothetical protein
MKLLNQVIEFARSDQFTYRYRCFMLELLTDPYLILLLTGVSIIIAIVCETTVRMFLAARLFDLTIASDPPNARLSVYEPGHQDNTLVVVEISHPVIEGKDLVYN